MGPEKRGLRAIRLLVEVLWTSRDPMQAAAARPASLLSLSASYRASALPALLPPTGGLWRQARPCDRPARCPISTRAAGRPPPPRSTALGRRRQDETLGVVILDQGIRTAEGDQLLLDWAAAYGWVRAPGWPSRSFSDGSSAGRRARACVHLRRHRRPLLCTPACGLSHLSCASPVTAGGSTGGR